MENARKNCHYTYLCEEMADLQGSGNQNMSDTNLLFYSDMTFCYTPQTKFERCGDIFSKWVYKDHNLGVEILFFLNKEI